MELIGSILLTLAVAVLVVLFIGRPFFLRAPGDADEAHAKESGQEQQREHQLSALMAERDRVILSLQELDFDYGMGKVPEEDYPYQRAVLVKSGADSLRRLDELQAVMGVDARPSTVEDRIEAAVAARRADASTAVPGGNGSRAGDSLEDLIAARKRERTESAVGFCPKCGKPVQKSDKFCSRCGAVV